MEELIPLGSQVFTLEHLHDSLLLDLYNHDQGIWDLAFCSTRMPEAFSFAAVLQLLLRLILLQNLRVSRYTLIRYLLAILSLCYTSSSITSSYSNQDCTHWVRDRHDLLKDPVYVIYQADVAAAAAR